LPPLRKGGRRATVVLPPTTAVAVDAYLTDRARRRPDSPISGPLLATTTGGQLDLAALWKLVRRLARTAGIPSWDHLSPHSLRHTAITLALDAGRSAASAAEARHARRYRAAPTPGLKSDLVDAAG
jgi:integrase/recombinase XerD